MLNPVILGFPLVATKLGKSCIKICIYILKGRHLRKGVYQSVYHSTSVIT